MANAIAKHIQLTHYHLWIVGSTFNQCLKLLCYALNSFFVKSLSIVVKFCCQRLFFPNTAKLQLEAIEADILLINRQRNITSTILIRPFLELKTNRKVYSIVNRICYFFSYKIVLPLVNFT